MPLCFLRIEIAMAVLPVANLDPILSKIWASCCHAPMKFNQLEELKKVIWLILDSFIFSVAWLFHDKCFKSLSPCSNRNGNLKKHQKDKLNHQLESQNFFRASSKVGRCLFPDWAKKNFRRKKTDVEKRWNRRSRSAEGYFRELK